MNTSATLSDIQQDRPVLLVDKKGILSPHLLPRLITAHVTVVVSAKQPTAPSTQCIFIPFRRSIPVIPENNYSHMFIVYQGEKELLNAIPSFLAKAREQAGKVIFITTIFQMHDKKLITLSQKHPDLQILILGDSFGDLTFAESDVSPYLTEAKTDGKVIVPGDGLSVIYPVHTDDIIEAVLVLGMGTPGSGSFALFPKHPVTILSFVRLLQRSYPLLRVDFGKEHTSPLPMILPPDLTYIFGPSYPLEQRLKKIDLTHTALEPRKKRQKRHMRKPHLSPFQRHSTLVLSILFFVIASPLLLSVVLSAASGAMLVSARQAFEQGNIEKAEGASSLAVTLFHGATYNAYITKTMATGIGLGYEVTPFYESIQTGSQVSEAVHEGLGATRLIDSVVQGKSVNPREDFYTGLNKGREAIRLLQQLVAEEQLPRAFHEELAVWQPSLRLLANTMETYPQLLGFEGRKTYLILFQNNYELRPTGGFIGSYGLVSVDQGRVGEITIHDVYDADGQLKQKIVPPFGLSRYLGATNWFLRDSNYYLDYPTSAATAANFLKMETGKEVDGVIAIDVHFLASLLEVTGPLSLPDYGETLTTENFFLTTQTHAEKDFFPGSTQKKDFLRAVRQSLETKIGQGSATKLLSVLTTAVAEKHVLFAFADPQLQQVFTVNNLSASILDTREKEQGRVHDFLYVNEANIGQTKGNYYLKRTLMQRVAIDGEGRIKEELEIQYQNTSTQKSPFGGAYKSYVRVVLPEDATLTEFRLDGRKQVIVPAVMDRSQYTAGSFVPPRGIEIEDVKEDGKKVLGFFVSVPVQSTKRVTLVYSREERAVVNQATFTYDLLHLKQPGTDADPYHLELNYPVAVRLVDAPEVVSDVGGKLLLDQPLRTDLRYILTFAKQ